MRTMSRIWTMLVVGASLGLTVMWVSPAKAGPLFITTTDWATFSSSYLGASVAGPLTDYFDFSPSTPGFDGAVISAVYQGAGSATGLYVYLYQLKLYTTSSASYVSGVAFDVGTPIPPATIGGVHVFTVNDAPILFGSASPNTNLTSASWSKPSPTTGSFSFNLSMYRDDEDGGGHDPSGDSDPPYEDTVSYLWAFFHPLPPVTEPINPKDGGQDLLNPLVYAPSPEPSAVVLLSFGLLGLGIFRRRK